MMTIPGTMRRVLLGTAGLVLAGALVACTPGSNATPTPVVPPVRASTAVVAEGSVQPAQFASLAMATGGIIAEVMAQEGQNVRAGQPLVRLQNARQQAAVLQAEANLAAAEASLARAKAGPREEEIRVAEAAVRAAEAGVSRVGADPATVAQQQAAVRAAQAEYNRVAAGATDAQLAQAQTNLEKAERAVQQAQAAYDQVYWRTDIIASPEALRLEQTTADLRAARAAYDDLVRGARSEDLAASQARVDQAQAGLAAAQRGGRPGDLAAAQADVDRAKANRDLVIAGARTEDIAQAEAQVRVAEAGVVAARAALDETELRAPFDGVVIASDLRVGEQVAPGVPLFRVADTSAWVVRTTDLTEISVPRVQVGSPVTLTFDALPGLELPGKVTRISGFGENRQGDINYTVWVTPDQQDPRLRWGMTASVRIDTPAAPGAATPAPSPASTPVN